jgi:hypothetical protein
MKLGIIITQTDPETVFNAVWKWTRSRTRNSM